MLIPHRHTQPGSRSSWRIMLLMAFGGMFVMAGFHPQAAWAQGKPAAKEKKEVVKEEQDTSQLPFSELLRQANDLLGKGNLVDAKPVIEELIERFEHAEADNKDIDLSSPTFTMAQACALEYQQSGDTANLVEALKWYDRFIQKYPEDERVSQALEAKSAIFAESGKLDEAVLIMKQLLDPPHSTRLPRAKLLEVLYNLVRIHYSQEKWVEGLPWFEKLLEFAGPDDDKRILAASAAFEAHMAANRLDKAMELLPKLTGDADSRYRPQINIALLRASDQLVGGGRYGDAALVLNLALTTPQMTAHFERRRDSLTKRIQRIESRDPKADSLRELRQDLATANSMLKVLADLPPLNTDLLIRKARNYVKTGRQYEAFWLFHRLHTEDTQGDQREFLNYAALANAHGLGKSDHVVELGGQYLKQFERGSYLEDVILLMLPHFRENDPVSFRKYTRQFLADFPDSTNGATVLSQYGQFLISEEEFKALDQEFAAIERRNPDSYLSDGLSYWRGMAQLVRRNYDDAFGHFERVVKRFPNSAYAAEAQFRLGVVHFAREEFGAAQARLTAFTEGHPDDRNVDQAFYFLAQIAKIEGDLEKAAEYYEQTSRSTSDSGLADTSTFERCELLIELGRSAEAIGLLEAYLADEGRQRDRAKALHIIGLAHEDMREMNKALKTYGKAIAECSGDPESASVDAVLLDYGPMVGRNRVLLTAVTDFLRRMIEDKALRERLVTDRGELFDHFYNNPQLGDKIYSLMRGDPRYGANLVSDPAPLALLLDQRSAALAAVNTAKPQEFINNQLAEARKAGDFLRETRLAMALDAAGGKPRLSRDPTPEDFAAFTLDVLLYAGRYAMDNGRPDLAAAAWQALLDRDPRAKQAISAHFLLAAQAREAKDFEKALGHYRSVHEGFPASAEAPVAILDEAALQSNLGNHEQARKLFERILRVPSWRGPLHARALFEIGRSFERENRDGEARGFYERVYIGYNHFAEWAARAYLHDAAILYKMNKLEDTRRLIREAREKVAAQAPPEVQAELDALAKQVGS